MSNDVSQNSKEEQREPEPGESLKSCEANHELWMKKKRTEYTEHERARVDE